MKNKLKKITVSVMAVTTLALGTLGMNASAYGGSVSFYVNGVSVTKSIDVYKSSAGASTKCTSNSCSHVFVSITCYNSSTGSKNDYFAATRGNVNVNLNADSGKSFSKANSYHSATINDVDGNSSMTAYAQ